MITLDVGTMGILYVNITASNIDFKTVKQIVLAMQYPDTDPSGAAISREFSFDTNTRTQAMVVALLKPVTKKYKYQITYVMTDGSQIVGPMMQDNTQQLFINNLFIPKTVSFMSEGDFTNEIDNIFLKMMYNDSGNKYQQTSEYTFTSTNRSHDWTFEIVNGGQGAIRYSGVISYKNQLRRTFRTTPSRRA